MIDGCWKLIFSVCAMRTENIVNGLPLCNYLSVCTNAPVSRREAFCKQYKDTMERIFGEKKAEELCKLAKGEMPKDDTNGIVEEYPQLKSSFVYSRGNYHL